MSKKNETETTVVYEVTEDVPTMENDTRKKIKKGVAIGVFAAGALLLIDDQVKKFRARKNVTVIVTDAESETASEADTTK